MTFEVERRCLNNPLRFRETVVLWVDAIAKSVTSNRENERNFLQQHVLLLLLLVEATLSNGSAACSYFGLSLTRTNLNSHQQGHTSVSDDMKCMRREQHSNASGEMRVNHDTLSLLQQTRYHEFYVHGTVHRSSVSINVQQDETVNSLFYL